MPELPEVETVRRQLARAVVGGRFLAVNKVEPAMLRDCTESQVQEGLPGKRILSIERIGKFLIAALSEDTFLTLHLGMTGHFLVAYLEKRTSSETRSDWVAGVGSEEDVLVKAGSCHSRFVFIVEAEHGLQMRLEFRDARKFGRLHFTTGAPAPRLKGLGPDAWEGAWDATYLAARLRGRSAPLKAFLLDQRHLAGIGNIYADEILWWQRLSPLRPAGSLSCGEIQRLAEEIPRRLAEGVRFLGCSLKDFVDTEGREGSFQDWLKAYGKYGQSCVRCGGVFQRVVIAGRGTSYCPGCQK